MLPPFVLFLIFVLFEASVLYILPDFYYLCAQISRIPARCGCLEHP